MNEKVTKRISNTLWTAAGAILVAAIMYVTPQVTGAVRIFGVPQRMDNAEKCIRKIQDSQKSDSMTFVLHNAVQIQQVQDIKDQLTRIENKLK